MFKSSKLHFSLNPSTCRFHQNTSPFRPLILLSISTAIPPMEASTECHLKFCFYLHPLMMLSPHKNLSDLSKHKSSQGPNLKPSDDFLSQKARLLTMVFKAKSFPPLCPHPLPYAPSRLTAQAWLFFPVWPCLGLKLFPLPGILTPSYFQEDVLFLPFRAQLKYYFFRRLP